MVRLARALHLVLCPGGTRLLYGGGRGCIRCNSLVRVGLLLGCQAEKLYM